MSLSPGSRIGAYEILGALGAGGMGEVYRARDSRLNRDVAVKVLPEAFSSDAERLARFTREAQTLASLNHPNIAAIYSIEANAIVMELVEGEDLSTLIAASGSGSKDQSLQLNQVLQIARQIIDALEAAHDLGIVHRDLKPANIKVREDGSVKVLDFGLAKTVESDGAISGNTANSPTLTARATQMGVILGTASYMSPEQARGRAVDKRTDVWAFGCVLYELLSGRKAFEGEDATEIISSVVKTEPDWNALPSSVPAHVRTVITRCLIKDRKSRIPDLSVVRYWLDEQNAAAASHTPLASARSSSRLWQAAAGVLLLTTLAALVAWYYKSSAAASSITRFQVLPPQGGSFTAGNRPGSATAAISPDGQTVAFTAQDASGKRMIYLRRIDSLVAQPLAGTEDGGYPFWSPDSRFIAFTVTGQLKKVAVAGGPPSTLCSLNTGIFSRGGTWNADDVLVFNNGPNALYRVSAAGGEATKIGSLQQGESGRQFPSFLPDGHHFLYHSTGTVDQMVGIWVGSLDGTPPTRVMFSGTGAVYDQRSGRLLFLQQGTLLAQPFDLVTFKLSGEPVPLGERVEAAVVPGVVAFSVSNTGVLAFANGEAATAQSQMTWVDRKGTVVGTVGPRATYRGINISPDGLQIAAHRHEGEGGDIWITDIKRNSTTRLTFDAAQENAGPVWSPGSDRVAYSSLRNGKQGLYMKNADGTGQETQLFDGASQLTPAIPFSWSPDDKAVLFMMPAATTAADLWTVSLSSDHKATPLLQTVFAENHGQISPDGKWLAYTSTETGTPEVYVRPAFSDTGKWNASSGTGNAPRWRGDGRELYFFANGKIMAVSVTPKGSAIVAGTPEPLFDYGGQANLGHPSLFSYAVTNDGQRFLISGANTITPAAQQSIVVVVNWDEGIGKK